MISRHALAIVTGSILATLVVGCAANEPESQEARDSATSALTPLLVPGICPDPAYSRQPAPYYQAKATRVVGYVVGGPSPFDKKELDGNPECKASLECATLLRDQLNGRGKTTLQPAVKANVCGLPAAVYAIDVDAQLDPSVWNAIATCGAHLDGCWGIGVSGFYYAETDQKGNHVYIDPEPARLSADLTGSTGATAAAVYTSSGTDANAVRWPGTYTSNASPPTAGSPCTTGVVLEGYETLKIIQGAGSSRRCY